jgi:hypothetical protein
LFLNSSQGVKVVMVSVLLVTTAFPQSSASQLQFILQEDFPLPLVVLVTRLYDLCMVWK